MPCGQSAPRKAVDPVASRRVTSRTLEVGRFQAGRVGSRAAVELGWVSEQKFAERRTARTVVNEPAAPIAAFFTAADMCPVHVERA